jgi:hypothetical protein
MRAASITLLAAVMAAGCEPSGLDNAFEPASVIVTGVVVDADDRPRPGSRLTFFSHPCAGTEAPLLLPADPEEVLTDAEGRFSATIQVPSNRRGRPDACLQVRAVLSSRIADPNYVLIPDSTDVFGRVDRSTLELNIKVPRGGAPGEPLWNATLSGGGASVTIVTTATNGTTVPIRFFLRSPGTVVHRAYAGPTVNETPLWDEELVPGGIKYQRMEFHLDPGQTRAWTRTLTADDVLRWPHPPGNPPLPEGVYTFESVVVQIAPRSEVLRLRAGTVYVGSGPAPNLGSTPSAAAAAVQQD